MMPAWAGATYVRQLGTSWASGVGQFGNTIGIGNGNPAGLDGLLALNFKNSALDNLGTQESTTSFDDHVWQFEDAITWTRGRHNIKFGGQFWRQIIKTFYAGNNGELGLMDFDGRFTSNTLGSAGNRRRGRWCGLLPRASPFNSAVVSAPAKPGSSLAISLVYTLKTLGAFRTA